MGDSWYQKIRCYKKRYSGVVVVFPIDVELYIAWTGGGGYYLDQNQELVKEKKIPVEMIKISVTKQNISQART